jgi:hypothetical protein
MYNAKFWKYVRQGFSRRAAMQKAKIKVIEKYLISLPDSASEQVISFVSYLNYMKNINNEYPYPDELAVIKQYRQEEDKLFDWDNIQDKI